MKQARIIAVNRFYAPDHSATAQLLTDLAEALVGAGRSVTIITSRLRYDDPLARLPESERVNGVTVHRVWSSRFGRATLIGRSIDYLTFYVSAFFAMLRDVHANDTLLVETDPPLISVPAAIATRLKRARLVNWCQDLYPETAAALGLRWAAGFVGGVLRALRNWSLNQAETNVVLCEAMRVHLSAQGVSATRLRVIHNWADAAIAPLCRGDDGPLLITYSGNLGRAHDVDAIIKLLESTRDIPGIVYRFVGGGTGTDRLQHAVRELGISNVTFEAYAPRSRLSESLANADLHLVSLAAVCEGLIMPSKIYGIMAAGRPTIFLGSPNGAVARILAEHDAGITLDSARPDTYGSTIRALLGDGDRLAEMSANARRAFEAEYSAECALSAWKSTLRVELAQQG